MIAQRRTMAAGFAAAGLLLLMSGLMPTARAQTDSPAPSNGEARQVEVRIALAGDSTVTDDAGWGRVFAKCYTEPGKSEVINLARGGRSSRSFRDEGLWQRALDLKPHYVLLQFGHNDEPGHGPERETEPRTTYREAMRRYVAEAKSAGAVPVLVTPLSRRQWGPDDRIHSSLQTYADVVQEIATEQEVPLIDLHARSIEVYESLGKAGCELISPPKPGGLDGTHLNEPGGRMFAEIMADELRRAVPALAGYYKWFRDEVQRAEAPQPSPHPLLSEEVTEPTPKGAHIITVAADGSGDFRTLQAAVAAAPSNNSDRTTIRIKPGVYVGQVIVPRAKPNLTFVGESRDSTILTYALNVKDPVPASVPAKLNGNGVVVIGDGFLAENITFRNTSGDHGQAMAVRVQGDRAVFRNCSLLGWQDTLMAHSNRQYFEDCYIEGRVDFIYGGSTVVFKNCEIRSKDGGYVTAASTPQEHPFGYVFIDCRLTSSDGVPTYLGRPWRPFASVTFLRCEMGEHIRPEGWHNWGKESNQTTARYAEYESKGTGAQPDKRVSWSRQLSAAEADAMTVAKVLGGADGWDPSNSVAVR